MRRALQALAILAALTSGARADGSVQIGLGVPLKGPDLVFGEEMRAGAEQAVADLNAAGGILGNRIQLVIGDDASDPKTAGVVAHRFVDRKIPIVIGHFSSATTLPASAIYAGAGILDVTPSAIAPQVTERGFTTVFRMCGREDQQAGIAAKFLIARRYTKIAILHDRSTSGKAFADAVRAQLARSGTTEAFYGSIAPETRDAGPLLQRLRATGAQIVVWGGGAPGAGLVVRTLHDLNARTPVLGSMALASDEFATAAGAGTEGTFVVFGQDPRERSAALPLIRRMKDRGTDAFLYTFYAYAAVQVVSQAAEEAKSLDPARIATALHGHTFKTVLGPIAFDAKGDPVASDFTVQSWRKGTGGRLNLVTLPDS